MRCEVQLTLRASVVREGQVRFTADALRFFGESHARTQCRRLLLQVQAEARAVKEEWALDESECLKRAMIHIHARVLEGYMAPGSPTSSSSIIFDLSAEVAGGPTRLERQGREAGRLVGQWDLQAPRVDALHRSRHLASKGEIYRCR